jgi:hypothetical protein
MDRPEHKKKDWVVGHEAVGKLLLRFAPDLDEEDGAAGAQEQQTDELLRQLDVPTLQLEDDLRERGCDPYDKGFTLRPRTKR